MRRPPANSLVAKLTVITALALAPKCLLCGLAYAGLLGLGGVELCGATPTASWPRFVPETLGGLTIAALLVHQAIKKIPASRHERTH